MISYQRLPATAQESVAGLSHKIHGLMTKLKKALDEDKLQDIKGIGQKTPDTMRHYVSEHESQD